MHTAPTVSTSGSYAGRKRPRNRRAQQNETPFTELVESFNHPLHETGSNAKPIRRALPRPPRERRSVGTLGVQRGSLWFRIRLRRRIDGLKQRTSGPPTCDWQSHEKHQGRYDETDQCWAQVPKRADNKSPNDRGEHPGHHGCRNRVHTSLLVPKQAYQKGEDHRGSPEVVGKNENLSNIGKKSTRRQRPQCHSRASTLLPRAATRGHSHPG